MRRRFSQWSSLPQTARRRIKQRSESAICLNVVFVGYRCRLLVHSVALFFMCHFPLVLHFQGASVPRRAEDQCLLAEKLWLR